MIHPLSKRQMAVICQLAGRAYKALAPALDADMSLDDFRHAELLQAVGSNSLRACDQRDYVRACNHFRAYISLPPMGDRTHQGNHARKAWCVQDAAARYELTPAYVAAIVRDKFALDVPPCASLAEICGYLTPDQLDQLLYTITSRGRRKVRQTSRDLDLPLPTEHHASPATLPPGGLADHFRATT